ncbi:MAG TPA: hypothetical protein VGX76_01250 [Pirellulales bacterium]|jgi:hypothetical protein|nr:hypothetical protein [Pirellulales bacterium]
MIAAAPNLWELDEQLDSLRITPTKRKKMVVDYIPDPAQGLPTRW